MDRQISSFKRPTETIWWLINRIFILMIRQLDNRKRISYLLFRRTRSIYNLDLCLLTNSNNLCIDTLPIQLRSKINQLSGKIWLPIPLPNIVQVISNTVSQNILNWKTFKFTLFANKLLDSCRVIWNFLTIKRTISNHITQLVCIHELCKSILIRNKRKFFLNNMLIKLIRNSLFKSPHCTQSKKCRIRLSNTSSRFKIKLSFSL